MRSQGGLIVMSMLCFGALFLAQSDDMMHNEMDVIAIFCLAYCVILPALIGVNNMSPEHKHYRRVCM